jgi:hypothetical protein
MQDGNLKLKLKSNITLIYFLRQRFHNSDADLSNTKDKFLSFKSYTVPILNLNYIYLLETMYNILLRFVYALCVCYFACNCNDITKDHDIAEIMLKLTLNTNQSINQSYNKKLHKLAKLVSHPWAYEIVINKHNQITLWIDLYTLFEHLQIKMNMWWSDVSTVGRITNQGTKYNKS